MIITFTCIPNTVSQNNKRLGIKLSCLHERVKKIMRILQALWWSYFDNKGWWVNLSITDMTL